MTVALEVSALGFEAFLPKAEQVIKTIVWKAW
jgi:hypothetical protein